MKSLRLIFCLACLSVAFVSPVVFTGCASTPSSQNTAVQTLKAVGETAEAAETLSAQLFNAGKITAEQALRVNVLYDSFQSAFVFAVAAVQENKDMTATPDLIAQAGNLAALVNGFHNKTLQ